MGEHQCPHCGHITTGFEQQEFEIAKKASDAKEAEISRLREAVEDAIDTLEAMDLHTDNPLYSRLRAVMGD